MDRLDAIRLFTRVVEKGSFSAAAREIGIGQSAASKQVAALEKQLGTQLLQRNSRNLMITEAGRGFYSSALRLLEDYAEMEARLGQAQAAPSGLLRIAVAPVFGRLYIVPHLPELFSRFPGLRIEMLASDQHVNMIEAGIDLAIRHGELADSTMISRRLTRSPFILVASPAYVDHHGMPQEPRDLEKHACIAFTGRNGIRPWAVGEPGGTTYLHHPVGSFQTNDGEQVREAIFSGLGIAYLPAWLVLPELSSGQIVHVLKGYQMGEETTNAVFPAGRRNPAKLQVFLDFLVGSLGSHLP